MFVGPREGKLRRSAWALVVIGIASSTGSAARADDADAELPKTALADDSLVVVEVRRAVRAAAQQIDSGETDIELRFADTFDWIQTKSGEWLRGDVDWMRDNIMEFDSSEFGALEIHMRDVAGLHAVKQDTYVFRDRTALYGRAMLTANQVIIQTEEGVEVRPRADLWAIVEGGGRELDHWSMALETGLSANRGNSNQVDFNLSFQLVREDRRTLTELAYWLNLGRADGEQNVARHIVGFRNRVWITRILFVEPVVGHVLNDKFQDIALRAAPAAAVGVRFLDQPKAWWNVSTGPGYQYLKLFDPLDVVDNPQHDGLVLFATEARFDMTNDIYLLINWSTRLTFTHLGNTNHIGSADLLIEVTNILNFDVRFLYLRTEEPAPRANGSIPSKNDYLLVFGVALHLG